MQNRMRDIETDFTPKNLSKVGNNLKLEAQAMRPKANEHSNDSCMNLIVYYLCSLHKILFLDTSNPFHNVCQCHIGYIRNSMHYDGL